MSPRGRSRSASARARHGAGGVGADRWPASTAPVASSQDDAANGGRCVESAIASTLASDSVARRRIRRLIHTGDRARAGRARAYRASREWRCRSARRASRGRSQTIAHDAAVTAIVSVSVTSVWAYVFTAPQMPRVDPLLRYTWFVPTSPLFTVVWLTLTLSMAASFYLVLRAQPRHAGRRKAIFAFVMQMILQSIWACAFFAFTAPVFAVAGDGAVRRGGRGDDLVLGPRQPAGRGVRHRWRPTSRGSASSCS